jgi:protein-tyrosine phosphatase
MAGQDAPVFGRVLTSLAAPDGAPALVHCTAGKARTGMAAALLLAAVGVPTAAILDDYTLSRRHYSEHRLAEMLPRLRRLGLDESRYHAVFGAPRSAMEHTLAALRDRHGSVEAYLTGPCGVAPATLAALRERLVG